MAKIRTQINVLEECRGEREMSVTDFCAALGVSRAWWYQQIESRRDVLSLQALNEMAVDHVGEWLGELAVTCIRLIDERFVPCVCQTRIGDSGACPKHVSAEVVA